MRSFRYAVFTTVVAAACSLLASCATAGRPSFADESERTVVEVENQRTMDMNVFVLNGAQRVRLGRVGPKATVKFTLPKGMVTRARELEFVSEVTGSMLTPAVSNRIWVGPGEHVGLIITP